MASRLAIHVEDFLVMGIVMDQMIAHTNRATLEKNKYAEIVMLQIAVETITAGVTVMAIANQLAPLLAKVVKARKMVELYLVEKTQVRTKGALNIANAIVARGVGTADIAPA
jgi:hypothetical protein